MKKLDLSDSRYKAIEAGAKVLDIPPSRFLEERVLGRDMDHWDMELILYQIIDGMEFKSVEDAVQILNRWGNFFRENFGAKMHGCLEVIVPIADGQQMKVGIYPNGGAHLEA